MILEKIKDSRRLEQILLNFIEVLRINMLVVDAKGTPVLVPKTSGYGFHGSSQWGILQYLGRPEFLSKFEAEGPYLKAIDMFGFQCFAIPIAIQSFAPIGYLIVGPVILNKALDQEAYRRHAMDPDLNMNFADLLEYLNEIRVLSFNSLKSTLDLLFDLSKYALKMNATQKPKPMDLIFINLLDLSMALTQAEYGSVMLLNQTSSELKMLVFRGIDIEKIKNISVKIGDGIAGLAAQEKKPFVINDGDLNNRIRHLLKKPELKSSLVVPILNDNKDVMGVLNISTRRESSRLNTQAPEMLESLERIITALSGSF